MGTYHGRSGFNRSHFASPRVCYEIHTKGEFGQMYIGSNLRRKRNIQRKRGIIKK